MNDNTIDSPKIPRAIDKMKDFVSDEGKIVITVPIGYNPILDNLLKENKLSFTKIYYLKRIDKDSMWIEASKKEVENLKFGEPFNNANGLVIGIIE